MVSKTDVPNMGKKKGGGAASSVGTLLNQQQRRSAVVISVMVAALLSSMPCARAEIFPYEDMQLQVRANIAAASPSHGWGTATLPTTLSQHKQCNIEADAPIIHHHLVSLLLLCKRSGLGVLFMTT